MALILKDRVKETSSSSGTGSITLGGAFPGYQTFNAAIASGSTVYYTIHNLTSGFDTEWEVGVGTFTSPSTLSRDTVLSSSTGSKVNFTSGASGLEVFVTQPAEEAVYINQATGKVEALGNGTSTIDFTNINASNVVMVSGTISTNASNATDITNKSYVDGVAATGLSYHTAVQVATTQSLAAQTGGTVTYNQPGGAGNGVGATITLSVALNTLDGYSLANTNRVLVKDETNQTYNGVYTWATGGTVLTRATDADTYGKNPNQLSLNDYFYVQNGNTNKGTAWVVDDPAGTITFGTSNINFALFSSAQVYSAGTGLTLSNTTFSISNTAVTANTYGNDGAVGQFTVNAQGQLTAASTVPINASAITTGTLANARTTASDANGASTIVSRDSTGSFTANTITATTSNATTFNGTTGSFTNVSGNGSAISAINASNISSGTIANARTTGSSSNSASTIVLRDANGAFEAGNVTAANFIGAGSTITSINGSNVTSGTVANARTTAASANGASTIVQRDAGGNFSANTITANISGDISGGTNINASNITSGTINNARTTASSANGASTIVLRDTNGSFDANVVNATNLSGGGTSITSMNASNLSAGTVASARVSGSYTGITGVGTVTAGTWNANVIANAYTTANSANGASTIVARDASGAFSAGVITANGSALSAINASAITTGTIDNARTTAASANGASTIVARDASGNAAFNGIIAKAITTGGGTAQATRSVFVANSEQYAMLLAYNTATNGVYIGATSTANTFAISNAGGSTMLTVDGSGNGTFAGTVSGNGAPLTAINASNISSGTLSATYGGTGSANLTADNVILGNGASAVKVVAPGTANNVLTSNGTTWVSQAAGGGFASGTVMLFAQTSAPTGWTKNTTTGDNSALRVTTGAASTGGSVAFTTAFASQTPTITITGVSGSAGATTLTIPQMPSHNHTVPQVLVAGCGNQGRGTGDNSPATTSSTGGSGSHTHPFSFSSGTATSSAINLAVQYIDVIRASKD